MLFIKFLVTLICDFFRCPLQVILNRWHSLMEPKELITPNSSIKNDLLSDVLVVVHHFAPNGIKYQKKCLNRTHEVGVGIIFQQLNGLDIEVRCCVADSDDTYFESLKLQFPNIKFHKTNGEKYDFPSYFYGARFCNESHKYYCMFNDNVDVKSDIVGFIKAAKSSIDNINLGMVGVGSNTLLIQSIFRESFSPHIQTYGFLVEKQLFEEFSARYEWYQHSWEPKFFRKQGLCRLLEQGLSKYILSKELGLGFIQMGKLITYTRRSKWFDLHKDWIGIYGDWRGVAESPFLFEGFKNDE